MYPREVEGRGDYSFYYDTASGVRFRNDAIRSFILGSLADKPNDDFHPILFFPLSLSFQIQENYSFRSVGACER